MTENKNTLREWSKQLETGGRDDDLLAVAARLERAGQNEQAVPSVEFHRQLKRDLLNQYATTADSPASRFWRWAGSAVVIGLLTVVVTAAWLTMSSAGRTSTGGAPLDLQTGPEAIPGSDQGYQFLGYSTSGGMVTEKVTEKDETGETTNQTETHLLVPGMTLNVTLRLSLPPDADTVSAFVHLLNDEGQIVAQADAPVLEASDAPDQPFAATVALTLPADLLAGEYELVGGLYEPETGTRLPISTEQGESTTVELGRYEVSSGAASDQMPEFLLDPWRDEASPIRVLRAEDTVSIQQVTPEMDAVLTGTQPITFEVALTYTLASPPPALLEIKIVALEADGGRDVATTTITLDALSGNLTVPIVLQPEQELNGATELGLWIQIQPDENSAPAPSNIGMSVDYRWRYEP